MTAITLSVDQLTRPQPGGIATYVRGLIQGLADVDPKLELVGVGPWSTPRVDGLTKLRRLPLPISALTLLWSRMDCGISGSDIAHATSLTGPFGNGDVGSRSAIIHDLLWRDFPEYFTNRGRSFHERAFQKVLMHEELKIVVTSKGMRSRLLGEGVAAERVSIVRLGTSPASVKDDASMNEVLATAGVSGPFILTVGTIEPRKNLNRLAEAYRSVPDIPPLLVVGATGWGVVDTRGLTLLGVQSNTVLAALREKAQAHVFVPIAEGWGLPAVEALAVGKPLLVSSSVPSSQGRSDAIVVNPESVEDIAEGLTRVLSLSDDEESRRERIRSVTDLTWKQCAQDHLSAWGIPFAAAF